MAETIPTEEVIARVVEFNSWLGAYGASHTPSTDLGYSINQACSALFDVYDALLEAL